MVTKQLTQEARDAAREKKVYTPPAFVVYGLVKDVTAGGSRGDPEGKAIDNPNKSRP
jgi:hypothetical protein